MTYLRRLKTGGADEDVVLEVSLRRRGRRAATRPDGTRD